MPERDGCKEPEDQAGLLNCKVARAHALLSRECSVCKLHDSIKTFRVGEHGPSQNMSTWFCHGLNAVAALGSKGKRTCLG